MSNKYVLAFDCGTTALKAVVIDFDGKVICNSKADCDLYQPKPGWAEQDPQQMWDAICRTTREVVAKAGISKSDVGGIVFVAAWKHIIPVDKDGNVLHRSMIWMDARGSDQAARLNEKMGCFVGTGQEYWPRLMWLKENEPEIWQKADKIMGINTFFKWKATGRVVTEPSDDFIHSFNPRLQEYYSKILDAAGLTEDLDKFPAVELSTDVAGKLIPAAAEEMGLEPGVPVFGGFGDLPAITIGTGCCQTGMAHIYFGTSSWLVDVLDDRREDYAPQYFTFDPTHEGGLFALQTGCMAFDWALDQFYHAERQELGDGVYDLVEKDVSQINPGSDNLIATHWLNGELPPLSKNGKAVFFNITSNHDRRHMVRAMMESICYTHRRYLGMYEKANGKKLESVRVVGGGVGSDAWMQMLADILQITVEVPESPRYTGAMGAYYCAMVGLGRLADYNAIYDAVRIQRRFEPQKENAAVYDKLYEIYLQLHPALKGLYDEINGVY